MDGPRRHRYRARRGYHVRTRCIRGCSAGRQSESPFRLTAAMPSSTRWAPERAVPRGQLVDRTRTDCEIISDLAPEHAHELSFLNRTSAGPAPALSQSELMSYQYIILSECAPRNGRIQFNACHPWVVFIGRYLFIECRSGSERVADAR